VDPRLLAGALLGWALGANDAASVFGLAITSRMVKVRTALGLTALFVVVGAGLQGFHGIATYGQLGAQTAHTAFVITLVPALAILVTATLGLPISTTQTVVGAFTGVSLLTGTFNWPVLAQLGAGWALAPLGALAAAYAFYLVLGQLLERWLLRLSAYEVVLKAGFVLVGAYGAYSLGANNVANVAGVWVASGALSPEAGAWLGAGAISLGVLTYSHRVIATVGDKLAVLDPFPAFVAALSSALTLHLYALAGVPVSASQAIVGAVVGIGLVKGAQTVQRKTVLQILFAWFVVPVIAALLAAVLFALLPRG